MQNSTTVSHPLVMSLTFGEMTSIKYLYCVFVLVGYVLTILANITVIAVITLHQTLHKPMYIFISTLCFNGLYGSSAFYPSLFINLLYKAQTISYVGCLLQVYAIHTYGTNEITILTVMGFDRYVIYKLIAAAFLYTFFWITIHVILTSRLPLCDSVILKIYCDNWSVVRLSCVDTTVNNAYGILTIVAIPVVMPILIFISYVEILRVCARSSKDFRSKALQTCAPHLISITNYLFDVLFELTLYRYTPTNVPYGFRVFMSLNFLVVPPLLNPLVYGFKIQELRIKMAKHLLRK
ncbi:hypothetical protein GDO86_019947 [Hymenochirus boettgeri]|uniref:G-protein coupled receptors family 1 profile domain-containing protein n=1 Tax=Hymenochirus boettgeri TaxID=247094 RepID=A0A8T2IND7_9PIPI|nr:hypothetical protein GDO86_019947 [Hymenochirus boettgeri]